MSGKSLRWWQPRRLGALERRDGDHAGGRCECDVFEPGAGAEGAGRGLAKFFVKPPQAGAVAHHRRVVGHRALQCGARQRDPCRRLGQRRVCRPGVGGVGGSSPARPPAHHEPLQQAVGRQPVGTVHPGACHLARGEQTGQLGTPAHVGQHTAAAVMRARYNRDELTRRVDSGRAARRRNGGKPLLEPVDRAGIQVHARVAGGPQPSVDRRGNNVTRRQIAHRVNACGHRIPARINQSGAFAAHSLADQRPAPLSVAVEQHGRVELNELQVANRRARPQRKRDPVARRPVGVGRRAVEMAEPAGGQHHRRCVHHAEPIVVDDEHP